MTVIHQNIRSRVTFRLPQPLTIIHGPRGNLEFLLEFISIFSDLFDNYFIKKRFKKRLNEGK